MAIFGRRRSTAPRLAPELDDSELGKVREQLVAPQIQGQLDLSAGLVEQVIQAAGTDWDRRAHRMRVLAEAASRALAQVWRRQRPQDADALLFQAWVELAHARREGVLADPHGELDKCRRVADQRPQDPTPWVVQLAVLRSLRRPKTEVFPICREIGARDAWNREAHLEMLGYLGPQEGGSHAEVLEFVDAVRAGAPPDAPVAALELTMLAHRYQASLSAGGVTALGARRRWERPDAVAALERAVAHWPRPGFLRHAAALADLNLLAYALVHANRTDRAAEVFEAIGPTVTPWPWSMDGDPLHEFTGRQRQL